MRACVMHVGREVLLEACELFEADPAGAEAIRSDDAALYRVRRGEELSVLRLIAAGGDSDADERERVTRARWQFSESLGEAGVRVAAHVRSRAGNILERIRGSSTGWIAGCVHWLPGRPIESDGQLRADAGIVRAWGRLMASMHVASESGNLVGSEELPDWRDETSSFLAMSVDPEASAEWEAMIATLETLPRGPGEFGPIHNDLHGMNVLANGDDVTAVDFDVACRHWYACDLATAMQAPLWSSPSGTATGTDGSAERLRLFLEGYREVRPFGEEWVARINLFLSYRRLLLYTVFSNEWRRPSGWQRHRLQVWRNGIVENRRVLPLLA